MSPLRHVWISLLGVALTLMGCSTMTNREVFPPGRETVQQVYDRHFQRDSAYAWDAARRQLTLPRASNSPTDGTAAPYDRFTRDAVRELQTLFPPLANRELAMYVFPHLATDGLYPVPGYITTFWLYEGHPYALPGERVAFPP